MGKKKKNVENWLDEIDFSVQATRKMINHVE